MGSYQLSLLTLTPSVRLEHDAAFFHCKALSPFLFNVKRGGVFSLWVMPRKENVLAGERVAKRRNRPLEAEYPYVFVDGIWRKRSWAGEVRNVSVLVAIGVSASGFREILGV